jgi:3-hydroxyanthranilate 3,4-dioxygenase
LVIERSRSPKEIDRFIWPCEKCGNELYATEVRFDDPGDAVAVTTRRMKSDPALSRCQRCGTILEL